MKKAAVFSTGTAMMLVSALMAVQAATAQEKEPVVVGVISNLSGPESKLGTEAVGLAELYVEYINAKGGVDGRKFELVVGDNENNPDKFISLGKRFMQQRNVMGFTGTAGSGEMLAFEKAVKNTSVPICLSYTMGNKNVGADLPSVFRIGPYNGQVAKLMANYLQKKNWKNVVVLAERSAFGTDFADALQALGNDDFKVDVVSYDPQAVDLSPMLVPVARQEVQPDAVVVVGYGPAIYTSAARIREAGIKSQIVGTWEFPEMPEFWSAAGDAGVGIMYSTFGISEATLTAGGKEFRKLFTDKFGREPVFYDYNEWDCLTAFTKAVEKIGSIDRETVSKAFGDLTFEGTSGQIAFTQDPAPGAWNSSKAGTMFMLQMGKSGQPKGDIVEEIR